MTMPTLRFGGLLLMSTLLTILAVINAFKRKSQFYLAMIHLSKSNTNLGILYLNAITFFVVIVKNLKQLLFGELRTVEIEHLMDRTWYATTETCLAFTMFRDDFHPRFIAMFMVLLVVKCAHWLVDDRISYAEQVPVLPRLFHLRQTVALLCLLSIDFVIASLSYKVTARYGASVQVVFGFEYAILFVAALATTCKYIMFLIDLHYSGRRAGDDIGIADNPWEEKATYAMYIDCCANFLRVFSYTFFIVTMVKLYTLPLFIIRPYYIAIRSLWRSLQDIIMARRALTNLNNMYPSVSVAELRQCSDTICIICREDMLVIVEVRKWISL
ncbi:hypothetical protein ACOME3_009928 [Neoechinorhynchus agilis]